MNNYSLFFIHLKTFDTEQKTDVHKTTFVTYFSKPIFQTFYFWSQTTLPRHRRRRQNRPKRKKTC